MRLNETEEEFDARIEEEYVGSKKQEAGLINAIEEERDEEPLTSLPFHIFYGLCFCTSNSSL